MQTKDGLANLNNFEVVLEVIEDAESISDIIRITNYRFNQKVAIFVIQMG